MPTTLLRALDAATGQERWNIEVLDASDPVVEDRIAVIATGDEYLLGLEASTGDERCPFQVTTRRPAHAPAMADGVAYGGGDGVGFFAVDARTGTLLRTADTGDDQTRTAVVAEGVAYIGGSADDNQGGHLYAFDAATGELLWARNEPSPRDGVDGGVAVAGGIAYVDTWLGGIHAIGGTDQRRGRPTTPPPPGRRPRRPDDVC